MYSGTCKGLMRSDKQPIHFDTVDSLRPVIVQYDLPTLYELIRAPLSYLLGLCTVAVCTNAITCKDACTDVEKDLCAHLQEIIPFVEAHKREDVHLYAELSQEQSLMLELVVLRSLLVLLLVAEKMPCPQIVHFHRVHHLAQGIVRGCHTILNLMKIA